MQNTSALKTTRKLKSSSPIMPAAQPDPLKENIELLDFMMLQSRTNIAVYVACLLQGFVEDPESLPPTIAYLQSRYLP